MKTVFVLTLSLYVIESTDELILRRANNSFTVERGQTLSPKEVQGFVENGTIVDTLNSAILALHEQQRRLEIQGFICASCLLRQINTDELEAIKVANPQTKKWRATAIWRWYIEHSVRPGAIRLRGRNQTDGLLEKQEYFVCAESLSVSYDIFCCHLHDNKRTVRVLTQYRNKANSKTIIDMLKEEHGDFLLTEYDMYFNNLLVEALGFEKFPYLTIKDEGGCVYAVPQVRDEGDFNLCPMNICMM